MKQFLHTFFTMLFIGLLTVKTNVVAQNNATVLDPNDVVTFLEASEPKPTTPASDNIIHKWYATKKISWNTTSFKPYIFNGLNFRLRYPKNYNPNDTTKKYPLILMFHGKAEVGDVYDNDLQLYNGGYLHDNAVNTGKFDGFLLYPQSTGSWSYVHHDKISKLLSIMVENANVDVDRIVVHGLSNGGAGTTGIIARYPKIFAAALPMCPVGGWANFEEIVHIPMWVSQGGLDNNPTPTYTQSAINDLKNRGADITYSFYPDLGHSVWNSTYNNADFFPYINRAHKANPLVYFGRTEFCPGDVVSVKMGLTPGFDAYEWRKDGVVIANATSNIYTATEFGVYEARIKRGTVWSKWSPRAVNVKFKAATVSPNITVVGINSHVLPAGNGLNSVTLQVPEGFSEYKWRKSGTTTILGTTHQLVVTEPGDYVVQIKELYGCSSNDSEIFKVIAANGANKPSAVSTFNAQELSKTSIVLNWLDAVNPKNNETFYEIYRSKTSGSGFTMIASLPSSANSYTDEMLDADTRYYYLIRTINLSGASNVTTEVNAKTLRDNNPPTTPENLRIIGVSRNYIDITWGQSTDDVGVQWYDIYVNGQKTYTTSADNNTFRVGGLTYGNVYTIKVIAKDFSGNQSLVSNQVTAKTVNNGFNYKYYEGSWNTIPNFTLLTPQATGVVDDLDLSIKGRDVNFGILYEGFINIPVTGNYTFETYSDDGSKLYIGSYAHAATALVNNDGAHGVQYREGTIHLTQGTHPIAVTYTQLTGGAELKVFWKNTAHGVVSRQQIPKEFFTDNQAPLVKPSKVSNVHASAVAYNQIDVSWIDNSIDETGFEIYRAESVLGPFILVGKADANKTIYSDKNLTSEKYYFYKIKTVGDSGESDFSGIYQELTLNFNNSFIDESGLSRTVVAVNNPAFTTEKKEGTQALNLNGTNNYVNIGNTTTGGFLNTAFNSRTISFWFNPQLLTQTRTIFDIGSSSNGISLRSNSTNLELGVASNNVRRTISTPLSLNTWSLITVVYNSNSIKLYKDGVLAVSANDLSFTSILATTDGSRIGYYNGSNAFNSNTNYYTKGFIDNFIIYNGALSESEIQSIVNLHPIDAKAKTKTLPVAPAVPSNFLAAATSTKSVSLNWRVDSLAYSPITYIISRSVNDTTNFVKIFEKETLEGATIDTGLLANTHYYYKIKAVHVGGESAFSTTVSVVTKNTVPVITAISNQTVRYDQPSTLALTAVDADGDALTFSLKEALSFLSIEQLTANTANLILTPTIESIGVHNVGVIVSDNHGGSDTTNFVLNINQNYKPSIVAAVSSLVVEEGATGELHLTATDENLTDSLSLSLGVNAPSFISLVNTEARLAKLVIKPSYSDAGVYNFFVKVDDNNGSRDSLSVSVTVNDVDPNYRVYVNFAQNSSEGGYWNNVNSPSNGKIFSNFKNDKLESTSIGLTVTSNWQTWWNNSGNNGVYSSALYPAGVTNTNWGVNNGTQTFKLTGLNTSFKYDLSFLSSSKATSGNYNTTISSGTSTVTINALGNTTQLANLVGLRADINGELLISISSETSGNAHINALLINASPSSTTVPASPKSLVAVYDVNTKKVKVNWQDAAFDEMGYEVYRAVGTAPFTLLTTLGINAIEYLDNEFVGNAVLYYKVRSINEVGGSVFTDSVRVTTPNRVPTISKIIDQTIFAGTSITLPVYAEDDAREVLTILSNNLPSFVTLNSTSNGVSNLVINPSLEHIGIYSNIILQVSDNYGGIARDTINITVKNPNEVSVKINFTSGLNAGLPWNNTNANPTSGLTISNLKDTNGQTTALSLQLLSAWSGYNNTGMNTENNSGIYPDNVIRTFYYDMTGAAKEIKISGLNPSKKYSFEIFASWGAPRYGSTAKYTVGSTTVTLNPDYNLNNTVKIGNIISNANGEAILKVERATGATFIFLGALIITEQEVSELPNTPTNLKAVSYSKNSINLTWNDESDNESGFEIYRSSSENGVYSLINTTAASVTNYSDNGLSANTIYWYKVRAVRQSDKYSLYSNLASAGTSAYVISINFNREEPAQAPWNNTNKNPEDGDVFNNLKDDSNINTSVSLTMVDNFSGANSLGAVTGNNSGKFPDVVSKWFYYSEKNETARMKISGLNQTMEYDFEFFGSRLNPTVNGLTNFTINGNKVILNPANNINSTVVISNIKPDQNGEIFIDIFMENQAQFAYLGAMIIKAHAATVITHVPSISVTNKASKSNLSGLDTDLALKVYPNPFIDYISLALNNEIKNNKVLKLQLVDFSGKVLKTEDYTVDTYLNEIKLSLQDVNLNPGVYLLKVIGDNTKPNTFKILKR